MYANCLHRKTAFHHGNNNSKWNENRKRERERSKNAVWNVNRSRKENETGNDRWNASKMTNSLRIRGISVSILKMKWQSGNLITATAKPQINYIRSIGKKYWLHLRKEIFTCARSKQSQNKRCTLTFQFSLTYENERWYMKNEPAKRSEIENVREMRSTLTRFVSLQ